MKRFGSWLDYLLPVGHDVHEINDHSHQKVGINWHSANGQSEEAKTADKVEDGGPLDDFLDWIGLMGGGSGGLKNFSVTAGRVEDFSAALQNAINALRRINSGISTKTEKYEIYVTPNGKGVGADWRSASDTNGMQSDINRILDSITK